MLRRDRGTDAGGGIIVYVQKTLKIERVCFMEDIEAISFTVYPNEKKRVAIIACYRPPHADNENLFFAELKKK